MCYDIPFVVGFCFFRFAFCSCHAFHIMSSCASLLHTCSSHASEHFPRCPFRNPALPHAPAHPSYLFSCAGIKHSWNGPRLAKWPWYTTGRPPVRFRSIWRGVLLQHTKGIYSYPVNCWSIKRPPNETKLDRWSTGGIPRPLGKTRSIPRTFNTRSRKEIRGVRRRRWECQIAKRTTGKMLGCMRRTRMQMQCT